MYIEKIDYNNNLFGDNIGFIENWDFSRANINDESRIEAITTVASICYDNDKIIGKKSLYDRLYAESNGLPSSSFEFVPVLIHFEDYVAINEAVFQNQKKPGEISVLNIEKYGEFIHESGKIFVITNLRAMLNDYETHRETFESHSMDLRQYYNSESQSKIIAKYYKTFRIKMDMATSKQFIRHRSQNLQELSRRYVSAEKTPFEFYISKKIRNSNVYNDVLNHIANSVELYNNMRKCGISPQESRRVIPQNAYTTIWSAWQPEGIKNFIKLRTDAHAQWEIRQIAQEMEKWIKSCDNVTPM